MASNTTSQGVLCTKSNEHRLAFSKFSSENNSRSNSAVFSLADLTCDKDVNLRLPKVTEITGLKKSSIYQKMIEGTFPQAIKIGLRAVAWSSIEILAWMEQRRAERRISPKPSCNQQNGPMPSAFASDLGFLLSTCHKGDHK